MPTNQAGPETGPKPQPVALKMTHEQIRQKFMTMARSVGIDQAITACHNEMNKLEPKVFDGGFRAERFSDVQFYRGLARDLYNYKLELDSAEYNKKK